MSGRIIWILLTVKEGRKRVFRFLLRLLVAVVLLTYLIISKKLNFSVLAERSLDYEYLLYAAVAYTIITLKGALRWYILLSAVGVRNGYLSSLRLTYLGHIFSVVLPGVVGGDAVKALILHREKKVRFSSSLSAALADRSIGLLAMITVALSASLLLPSDAIGELTVSVIVLILVLILVSSLLLFFFLPRIERIFKRVLLRLPWRRFWLRMVSAVLMLRRRPLPTVVAFMISIPAHIFSVIAVLCIIKAFGLTAPFSPLLFGVLVSLFIEALPISIAGLGVGEQAFDWLFPLLFTGVVATLGAEIALLMHITKILTTLPGIPLLFIAQKVEPSE